MKIVINYFNSEYPETISFENLNNIDETFQKFFSIKEPLEAKIFAINESISSHKLSKLKHNYYKMNLGSLSPFNPIIARNNSRKIFKNKFNFF